MRLAHDTATGILNGDILLEALEKTVSGDKKEISEEELLATARHEAGHTLINYLCGHIPAYVTVEPRANFGGYMAFSEEEIKKSYKNKKDFIDEIRCFLGGRAAEIVCYGEEDGITSGAGSDLANATDTAILMLTRFGIDRNFGMAAMNVPDNVLRERVNDILDRELEAAIKEIKDNKDKLDKLVKVLMDKNRVTGDELKKIWNGSDS